VRSQNDKSDYVIASGDWNITPYSPYFGDFLKSFRPSLPELPPAAGNQLAGSFTNPVHENPD
jgi:hypothetical protein